jgi:vitamin-K-epoxide reductase (warfarin-sensitive)
MRFIYFFFALCGIAVSVLALRVHYSTDVQPCSINEKWDCGIVNHSRFAEVAHVPVAAIGIAGYALLGVLALLRLNRLLLAASLIGLAFALYLTNIEARVLQVWCLYCVISQGIIAILAFLSVGAALFRKPA